MSELSDGLIDIGSDIAEPMFDGLSNDIAKEFFGVDIKAIAGETPGLKILFYAGKVFNSGIRFWQARKLQAFLKAVQNGTAGIETFEKLSAKQKQDLRAFVISQLDKQTSEKQAEALGYLVVAHLQGSVRWSLFQAVAHEIKNTNPMVYESFEELPYKRSAIRAGTKIEGPLHYLPAAFVANSSEVIASASFSLLTNLGNLFFRYVYDPMSGKLSGEVNHDT